MLRIFHRPLRAALCAVVIISLVGFAFSQRSSIKFKDPNMSPLSPRLQSIFAPTKTVCFGRFIMEVPATAIVVYGSADVDATIYFRPGEGGKVADLVTEQLGFVEKDRMFLDEDDKKRFPKFGMVFDSYVPGQKLVFGSKLQIGYDITSFVPVGPDLFILERGTLLEDEDEKVASLKRLASKMRLRAENEVPQEEGVCIDGGFIPTEARYENFTLGVRLKEFPDVHFSLRTSRNGDFLIESSDLKKNLEDTRKEAPPEAKSWFARVQYFRQGDRQLGHWQGYEVLARLPEQEHARETHDFRFVSLGAVNDALTPEIDIQLDTGVKKDTKGAVKPSLSDEEAVALWDKLTSSIRIRPTGGATTGADAPPKKPLGDKVVAGRACPQTGWWQPFEFAGDSTLPRRHFIEGEVFPRIVREFKPTLWQKLKGGAVAYGDAPNTELGTETKSGEGDKPTGEKPSAPYRPPV